MPIFGYPGRVASRLDPMPEYVVLSDSSLPCTRGVDALRHGVRLFIASGAHCPPNDTLRIAGRLMCDDARARGIQVEELIVSLKRAWTGLAEAERVPRAARARLLARVVTVCVEEFYAPLD